LKMKIVEFMNNFIWHVLQLTLEVLTEEASPRRNSSC